ncbi:MAG: DUF935 family protein [Bacteroidetes bacterium]|nr:DUF935 family protein [Bacteroidota bacterium]
MAFNFNFSFGNKKDLALKQPPITDTTNDAQVNKIMVDYFKTYQSLYRREIDDWQNARILRRSIINPTTIQLQQLYQDSLVDIFLKRQIRNRILRISNRTVVIKDKVGNIDVDKSAVLQTKVIRTIIKKAMESKFYGYSMLYVAKWEPGKIIKLVEIPRGNVIPELGLLLKDAYNVGTGIKYTDYPNFLLYSQLDDPIGLLEDIAPLTMLKRHSWASWDEFEQIFGIPLRIAKTMVDTQKHRDDLEFWLQNMGSAAYAILPKTVDLEVKPSEQTDSFNVFNEKRKAVNEEIAIGVNGQTMTTLQGSSRSQSETHLKTQDEITADDLQDTLDYLNDEIIQILRNLSYDIPEGYYFDLMQRTNIPVGEKAKIDQILLQGGYRLDNEYVEETYNVKLDKENPFNAPGQNKSALSFFV